MRSMRIALNHFLFKTKAVESDQCHCAEFMLQTGLLGQFRHVEIEPEPPKEGDGTTSQDRLAGAGGEDDG
jgi:hypothetical protein